MRAPTEPQAWRVLGDDERQATGTGQGKTPSPGLNPRPQGPIKTLSDSYRIGVQREAFHQSVQHELAMYFPRTDRQLLSMYKTDTSQAPS